MEWHSLVFEPLVFIGLSLLTLIALIKIKINTKYIFIFLYVIIIFYFFVATPFGANYLVSIIEVTSIDAKCHDSGIETVVILSGGITGDPDNLNEIWRLKEASYRRTLLGLELAKRLNIKTIIVSGGYGGRFSEAHLMEKLIYDIGFSGKVIKDRDSKSTYYSAKNVTKILLNKKIDNYWLVTSALHMRRAESVFQKNGIKPCLYPLNSQYVNASFPGLFVPQISALEKSTAAFHEIVGSIWYTVTGKN